MTVAPRVTRISRISARRDAPPNALGYLSAPSLAETELAFAHHRKRWLFLGALALALAVTAPVYVLTRDHDSAAATTRASAADASVATHEPSDPVLLAPTLPAASAELVAHAQPMDVLPPPAPPEPIALSDVPLARSAAQDLRRDPARTSRSRKRARFTRYARERVTPAHGEAAPECVARIRRHHRALLMRATGAVGIVLGLALGANARADAIPEKAKQLAERGREAHDRGQYVDAIAAFNEAYVLAPSAGLLFDLAQAYRLAGRCDDAAWMYRRYLDVVHPPSIARSPRPTSRRPKCGHGGLRVVLVPPASDAKLVSPTPEPELTATAPVVHRSGSRDKHFAEGFAVVGGALVATSVVFAVDAGNAASTVTAAYKTGDGKGKDLSATDSSGQNRLQSRARPRARGRCVVGRCCRVLHARLARGACGRRHAATWRRARGNDMAVLSGVRGLLVWSLAAASGASACYAPTTRDCELSCGSDSDCAAGQVCGTEHLCAGRGLSCAPGAVDGGLVGDGERDPSRRCPRGRRRADGRAHHHDRRHGHGHARRRSKLLHDAVLSARRADRQASDIGRDAGREDDVRHVDDGSLHGPGRDVHVRADDHTMLQVHFKPM